MDVNEFLEFDEDEETAAARQEREKRIIRAPTNTYQQQGGVED
jgi:hypothetical protein